MDIPGVRPSRPSELVRVQDRLSFVYVERATIGRDDSAITATDDAGVIHIPAASLGALLLGPGTRVTHQAMLLLADSGSTAVWVGERGVRYYAHGRPLGRTTRLLDAQARAVTNTRSRVAVARAMYEMRFPDDDVSECSMQQLRGREGARVRGLYRTHSDRTGVEWNRRDYKPDDFASSDVINQALSAAHSCLYGIVHSVVVALGCSPGLGFVHTGHDRSFVYDIADLYKADITIPVAFDVAETIEREDLPEDDVGGITRRAVRDAVKSGAILTRCVRDIHTLLLPGDDRGDAREDYADVIELWDDRQGNVVGGTNFAPEDMEPPW
ncbi:MULTISPECIES: type I-E CRISPR-associated endonuclease Cas1e [Gordonia]|uniref:CRISPR-associated endonuclease Cas1 n=1 Tax=Gordonia sihwensis NBRC 108236 TaxID=1223544 RepID=L7LKW5_9ACTN|nr:type I-E CRISPR-associated endonuclease Cas1e [Gordonia sihwensis]AUH69605.1 type I-E CRISPR-associated endonuclease Cas1 [Gordonia sp. YC-JH1]MBY4570218.1 subtype I-E CRISPR-associated endonuclease Cas1 [Gordonia sihwensis]GAC61790.1 putative CRISPR-associated protein [Gordonia sihwensis NBRC 108236]